MRQLVIGTIIATHGTFLSEFPPIEHLITANTGTCSGIVVAVIDTGIDYNHPELNKSLWKNRGELGAWAPPEGSKSTCRSRSCNGIDDDHNGYVDDVIGWDFVQDRPLPFDTHGHGTHISGLIASRCNPSIMTLKYYNTGGENYNNLYNTVRAIDYAVKNGAKIINYSSGGYETSPNEFRAIKRALNKGILFVSAAGNEGYNNTKRGFYPATYPLKNIISVASLDDEGNILKTSNFGTKVHIAAKGFRVRSTLPFGRYGTMTGTSQATAIVTEAAARLFNNNPKANPLDIRELLMFGSDKMNPSPVVSGRLNLTRSIQLQAEGFYGH